MGRNYRGKKNDTNKYDYLDGYNKAVFHLADDDTSIPSDYESLIYALYHVGVYLNVDKNNHTLSIEVLPEKYKNITKRNAGRKFQTYKTGETEKVEYVINNEDFSYDKAITYKFSDIIFMIFNQNMTDKKIMELLGMKRATYYRHKNTMMNSMYFKEFDKLNKLAKEDNLSKSQLDNINGNRNF